MRTILRKPGFWLIGVVMLAIAAMLWFLDRHGNYGINVLLRRGGTYWMTMTTSEPRLSPAMHAALRLPAPTAMGDLPRWKMLAPGFENGDLPVLADGREVDRILLSRIDPSRYRFVVRNDPGGAKGIDEWEEALPRALLIVNASYYDPKGRPDTPVVSERSPLGPGTYDARAGAFVARAGRAGIVDLSNRDWKDVFAHAENAMVSYPLLVNENGKPRVKRHSRWLANRSFVAQTRDGRIVIGSTRDAFFSLDRLADFLATAPLDIKTALNLDGGPVACQSIRVGRYHRKVHARWEAQVEDDTVQLLCWSFANAIWAMPMVLSVEPR